MEELAAPWNSAPACLEGEEEETASASLRLDKGSLSERVNLSSENGFVFAGTSCTDANLSPVAVLPEDDDDRRSAGRKPSPSIRNLS